MKTYLLKQLNTLLTLGDKLDELTQVKSIICDKEWHVFNDTDIAETYLFKNDGTLKIIYGGSVSDAKWEYEPVLKCIEVKANNNQNYMLQVAFFDEKLLALRLHKSDAYCFLIEEANLALCGFKTLNDITAHLTAIEDERQQKRLQMQAQKEQERKQEEARQQKLDILNSRYLQLVETIKEQTDFVKSEKWIILIEPILIIVIITIGTVGMVRAAIAGYSPICGLIGLVVLLPAWISLILITDGKTLPLGRYVINKKVNEIIEFVRKKENITEIEEKILRSLMATINWSDKTNLETRIKKHLEEQYKKNKL